MSLTAPQRMTVLRGIAEGYGVEDISVRENLPLDDVRAYMHQLARGGVFDRVFAGRKNKPPKP